MLLEPAKATTEGQKVLKKLADHGALAETCLPISMMCALTTTVSIARQVPVRRTTSEHASVVVHVANAEITLTEITSHQLFAAFAINWRLCSSSAKLGCRYR